MAAQTRMQIEHRCHKQKKLTIVVCSTPLASDNKMLKAVDCVLINYGDRGQPVKKVIV
jgi:hypothetical protein